MTKITAAIAIFLISVWAVWAAGLPVAFYFNAKWPTESLGQWGDSFGALNSLFAGFAAVGVTATLFLQRQSMLEQKRDQGRQRFEGHFFNLLSLSRELKRDIKTSKVYSGKGDDAIATYAKLLADNLRYRDLVTEQTTVIAETYISLVHNDSEAGLGAYFRTLFNILRLIDTEPNLTTNDRELYGNLLRAQLSSNDLILIGFNAFTEQSGNFSYYVKKYRILRYVPEGNFRSLFIKKYGKDALAARHSVP